RRPGGAGGRRGRRRPGGGVGAPVRGLVGRAREPARGSTLLVELKVVEAAYPLYGRLETEPARPVAELTADGGAIVQAPLLARLGLRVGDSFEIGSARFRITAVLTKEPDRAATLFTPGPPVLIAPGAPERTA